MRTRLLAFLLPAVLVTSLILSSASSLVSALERSLIAEAETTATPALRLRRYETECDRLYREIHALSHVATTCDADPRCLGSPLLCPVSMDEEIERDYQRLRIALNERCDVSLGLMDYAWGGPVGEASTCGASHDWLEAATSGQAEPGSFLF